MTNATTQANHYLQPNNSTLMSHLDEPQLVMNKPTHFLTPYCESGSLFTFYQNCTHKNEHTALVDKAGLHNKSLLLPEFPSDCLLFTNVLQKIILYFYILEINTVQNPLEVTWSRLLGSRLRLQTAERNIQTCTCSILHLFCL